MGCFRGGAVGSFLRFQSGNGVCLLRPDVWGGRRNGDFILVFGCQSAVAVLVATQIVNTHLGEINLCN